MELNYNSLLLDYTTTKKQLSEAESTIRRLTGRDPDGGDVGNGSTKFRPSSSGRTFFRAGRSHTYTGYDRKRTRHNSSGGKSSTSHSRKVESWSLRKKKRSFSSREHEENAEIDEYISPEEEDSPPPSKKPSLPSTIVAKHNQIRSRKATIEELNSNAKLQARNRRMFGALIGTLQKFEKEEKTRKVKESMRAEIEQKVEDANTREKQKLKDEKETLFITRRDKQLKLRILEKKIERAESHEVYDANNKKIANFIMTKAKPAIFFLPSSHVSASKKCLEETKVKMNELIDKKRADLKADLNEIEESYKKDSVSSSKGKESNCAKEEIEYQDVPETESESLVVEQEDSTEEDESTNDRPLGGSLIDQEFEPIYD